MFTFGKLLSAGAEAVEEWWAVRELLAATSEPQAGSAPHGVGKPGVFGGPALVGTDGGRV